MKNVFICGGAGFIGAHLTRRLLATPGVEKVTVFDNLSSGRLEWLPIGDIRLTFVRGNARDFDYLRVAMVEADADTVFHLAANPDIARAAVEPTIDFENGTVLTKNVIEAMRLNGVRRLIYFSGSGVYGDSRKMLREDNLSQLPISPYGAAKLAGEAMISAYCQMFGMVARAFRFANVVGPRQTHGVGRDFLLKLKADPMRLDVLGDGQQSKSYVHVDDILNAVILVCESCICDAVEKPDAYEAYNVATGDWLTVTEIAHMAIEVMSAWNAAIFYGGGERGWPGDVPSVRFDCGKIRQLGWQCKRNSREAMQDALEAMAKEIA